MKSLGRDDTKQLIKFRGKFMARWALGSLATSARGSFEMEKMQRNEKAGKKLNWANEQPVKN